MIFQGDSECQAINSISSSSQYSSNIFDFSSKQSQSNQMTQFQGVKSQFDYDDSDQSEERSSLKQIIKKIKKDKRKIIIQQTQSSMANLQDKAAVRYSITQIQKPIYTPYLFLFTGHVIVEFIDSISSNEFINQIQPITVQQLEKKATSFSIKPSYIDISKEFDMAIYLLENKQCQFQYNLGQVMKKFRLLAIEQDQAIKKIKDIYRNDYEILQSIGFERAKYRNEQIDKYIKENMQEDDFFVCHDNAINFSNNVTSATFLKFSKNIFALFGIEEDNVHLFLTKKEAFVQMMPQQSRKQLSWLQMQLQLQENKYQKIHLKGYQINTIEDIQICCDVESFIHPISYPKNLEYVQDQTQNLEEVFFIKFLITTDHLQNVLSQRQTDQNPFTEDIEYSVYSQIFLEKYYPNELKLLNKELNVEKDSTTITQEEQKIIEEPKNKTCNYRFIY